MEPFIFIFMGQLLCSGGPGIPSSCTKYGACYMVAEDGLREVPEKLCAFETKPGEKE